MEKNCVLSIILKKLNINKQCENILINNNMFNIYFKINILY